MVDSPFFYSVNIHRGRANATITVPAVRTLPLDAQALVVVLVQSADPINTPSGAYVYDDVAARWRFVIPYVDICAAVVNSSTIDVFTEVADPDSGLAPTARLWRNGVMVTGTTLSVGDNSVYGATTVPAESTGDVQSVNGVQPDPTGDVAIGIPQIPGLQDALSNAGKLKTVSGQAPDSQGNVVVSATDVTPNGSSLIANSGATTANIVIRTLASGPGIILGQNANGSVTVGATGLATATSIGTGVSLANDLGGTSKNVALKSLAQGAGIQVVQNAANDTITISAAPVAATTTTLGSVIVPTNSGISVAASGAIGLLPPTGVAIGGVKQGSGISIASDGTISVTAVGGVSSVSQQTGAVIVQATNNNSATGTSLISDSGATTANIKLKTLVQGAGITLGSDANGNVVISSTATGGVSSVTVGANTLDGALTLSAGPSISIANQGNTIQISGTGVPEAPNDQNVYGRGQGSWVVIPNASSAITSVTGQTGTNAVLLVEANPPANSAIIKSLVPGQNVTLTEVGGLITIAAQLPAGTVATVNNVAPTAGNVTLTAENVNALPIVGGTLQGALSMDNFAIMGLPDAVNAGDAVSLHVLQNLVIDGGVIG